MKLILGGSGTSDGICLATVDYTDYGGQVLCTNSADRAIAFAGDSGWWCCNCETVIATCGSYI